jgi:hypothetical protein
MKSDGGILEWINANNHKETVVRKLATSDLRFAT